MNEPLPEDVTQLLTAVVEALALPLPSIDPADERAHYRLLQRRTSDVRIVLESIVKHAGNIDLAHDAEVVRERTAATPVAYTMWRAAGGDES